VRERLDMPAPDDEEIAESYQSPAQAEAPEDEGGFGGGGGLFREARSLDTPQGVPPNAVSISDRSEAPEGASIVKGPGGGLYYVPAGNADGGAASGDSTASVDDMADGEQPRAEIDTPEDAAEFLTDEFDEDDFDFNHWAGGGSFEKVTEGSVVKIWAGDMGFEEEKALVVEDLGDDEFRVVTPNGDEKTLAPSLDTMNFDAETEAPLADVWNDSENRGDDDVEPEVKTEEVEDNPAWIEDLDFEEEFGAEIDTPPSVGSSVEVNGNLHRLTDETEDRGVEYYQTDEDSAVAEVDSVLTTVNEASNIETGATQYIQWSEQADMEDGWFNIDDEIQDDGGALMVDMVDENGDTHSVNGVAVEQEGLIERKHTPVEAESVQPENENAHTNYDGGYDDNPELPDNLSLDNISNNLDSEQTEQISRGLSKASDLGFTDRVEGIEELDVGGEAAGETLARFEPETGTIKINTDNMTQETLDGLSDDFGVGDTVEDMVVHETVHAAHAAALEDEGWTPEEMREDLLRSSLDSGEQQLIEDEISDYGASNPLEVVAEVGTKVTKGEEVSNEVMHIYERYGGPDL